MTELYDGHHGEELAKLRSLIAEMAAALQESMVIHIHCGKHDAAFIRRSSANLTAIKAVLSKVKP